MASFLQLLHVFTLFIITYSQNYMYHGSNYQLSHSDWEDTCLFYYDTHLASIHDNSQRLEAFAATGGAISWIGAEDYSVEEGTWAWTDGTAFDYGTTDSTLPWATGEPNDIGGEDCVEIDSNGEWNDNDCGSLELNYGLCAYPQPNAIIDDGASDVRTHQMPGYAGPIDILDEIYIDFYITFTSWPAGWGSILHFGNVDADRFPAIWIYGPLKMIQTNFGAENDQTTPSPALQLNTEYHYTLYKTQRTFTITFAAVTVYDDTSAASHAIALNQDMYLGADFGDDAFDATYRNLVVTTANSPESRFWNYICDWYNRLTERSGTWGLGSTDGDCSVRQSSETSAAKIAWMGEKDPNSLLWTDYKIEVIMKYIMGSGDSMGIIFRATGQSCSDGTTFNHNCGDAYYLKMSATKLEFAEIRDGNYNGRASYSKSHTVGVAYLIRVECVGNTFKVYEDNKYLFTGTDSSLAVGSVGLRTSTTDGRFSKLRITFPQKEKLECPAGSTQQGTINADVFGCGIEGCEARYTYATIDECFTHCSNYAGCLSFNWAPLGGDSGHTSERVCTIYTELSPDGLWGPYTIFCRMDTDSPTANPTVNPTDNPTPAPTAITTAPTQPTPAPTLPTSDPSATPSDSPSANPSATPTRHPTSNPTANPTDNPSGTPTYNPTANPTANPSSNPTTNPTSSPTVEPTSNPTANPSDSPTSNPTSNPTVNPSSNPTANPTSSPSVEPTSNPTANPSATPTSHPTVNPSSTPTSTPTGAPTAEPTVEPTPQPTVNPTAVPTATPTQPTFPPTANTPPPTKSTGIPTYPPTTSMPTTTPTNVPTDNPTFQPTTNPTSDPTTTPTSDPTYEPTSDPTYEPTADPTAEPTSDPTSEPTSNPTTNPTDNPSSSPTDKPTGGPTEEPTVHPTSQPTYVPTDDPTAPPTTDPSHEPTFHPTADPTSDPTADPTSDPTSDPTNDPTTDPTADPTADPTSDPTNDPTADPTSDPTNDPTADPTTDPTANPTQDPTEVPTPDPTTYRPTHDPTEISTEGPDNLVNATSGLFLTTAQLLQAIFVALVLIIFLCCCGLILYCHRKRKKHKKNMKILASSTSEVEGNGTDFAETGKKGGDATYIAMTRLNSMSSVGSEEAANNDKEEEEEKDGQGADGATATEPGATDGAGTEAEEPVVPASPPQAPSQTSLIAQPPQAQPPQQYNVQAVNTMMGMLPMGMGIGPIGGMLPMAMGPMQIQMGQMQNQMAQMAQMQQMGQMGQMGMAPMGMSLQSMSNPMLPASLPNTSSMPNLLPLPVGPKAGNQQRETMDGSGEAGGDGKETVDEYEYFYEDEDDAMYVKSNNNETAGQ